MLTGEAIHAAVGSGDIDIRPFNLGQLGANSYDVRLSPVIYEVTSRHLDFNEAYQHIEHTMAPTGFILYPGRLYLGCTLEWTHTPKHVMCFHGRSTVARYGVLTHLVAGFADIGFAGHMTLEIVATLPTRVYPKMRIGQLSFELADGKIDHYYSGGYSNECSLGEHPHPRTARPGNL